MQQAMVYPTGMSHTENEVNSWILEENLQETYYCVSIVTILNIFLIYTYNS